MDENRDWVGQRMCCFEQGRTNAHGALWAIDVRTGKVKPATWNDEKRRTVQIDLKDSVVAIADASFLDWPFAPEERQKKSTGFSQTFLVPRTRPGHVLLR